MYTTLVSTAELAQHLDDPNWVVFDCRFVLTDTEHGRQLYADEHIPGARYAHMDDDLSSPITATSGRHPLPDAATLAHKLGRWGVDADKQVVVYDDSFGSMAVRMWWLLRWLGHDKVALLDGVFPKWKREGRPLTSEAPTITPTEFNMNLCDEMWVDSETVQDTVQNKDYVLIDSRAEERYLAQDEPFDKVAGHIPGAINWPFDENLDISGEYMSPQEIQNMYQDLLKDVSPEHTVLMCGSGVTACHTILAMEHAGLKGAKLYAGSWSEWITDPKRPIATGELV